VTLEDFALLTDENIDPGVTVYLRQRSFDVADVAERGWQGRSDIDLLSAAFAEQRVIVSHDADFGRLAIASGCDLVGIVFLRPGHIDPHFTIDTIKVVLAGQFSGEPAVHSGGKAYWRVGGHSRSQAIAAVATPDPTRHELR
jgi:predicted nuclease of predicted toxin-antitoxin system